MCTASWLRHDQSFILCFNRDEAVTRQHALPPQLVTIDGVKVIMPIDPEGKGSWIGVNEYGLAICLLNNYGAKFNSEPKEWLSRGQIIRSLSTSTCIHDVDSRIQAMDLSAVRGFQILALCCRVNEPLISSWVWDGVELEHVRDGQQIFSSSAFNTQPVISNRRQFFETHIAEHSITLDSLRAFHSTEDPENGGLGICMNRSVAETVSYSEIQVSEDSVIMRYFPGRPSQNQLMEVAPFSQTLQRTPL